MSHLLLSGANGSFASTPDNAAFPSGSGAIVDVIIDVDLDDWADPTGQVLVCHGSNATSLRAWRFAIHSSPARSLATHVSNDGTSSEQDISPATAFAGRKIVRAKIDTSANLITYYHKDNPGDAWQTDLGTDVLSKTAIFDVADVLAVGATSQFQQPVTGKIYSAQVWSGDSEAGGTLVADPDFSAEDPGTTSFVDSVGRTWTLQGDAAIVSDSGIVISTPRPYQVAQRDADDEATVTVSGTYVGTPASIEYRTISLSPAGTQATSNWATLIASPSGNAYSADITLTTGTYTLELRYSDDTDVTASVLCGVGDNVVGFGQSNNSGRGDNNQTYDQTGTGVFAGLFRNSNSWAELADPWDDITGQVDSVSKETATPGGSIAPLIAQHAIYSQLHPFGFIPCAKGSTSITDWLPGADHRDRSTLYGSMIYRIELAGGAKVAIWWQGETDATAGMAEATYQGHLETIADALYTDVGIKMIPCLLQQISNGATTEEQQAIRDATEAAWVANANIIAGPDLSDLTTDDDAHLQTDAKLALVAHRYWSVIRNAFYGTSSQQGSQIVQYLGEVSVEIGDRLGSVGWPADPFVIGDAYTAANGRALQLTIKDAAGNVLTGLGDQSFGADAEFRFDPTTAIDTADFKASLTWVPAAGEEPAHYLWELTAAESAKALPLIEYTGQLILFPTTDGGIHKTTVLSRCFEFDAEIN